MEVERIQRTYLDYLGIMESMKNKDKLEELNARFDLLKTDDFNNTTDLNNMNDVKKPEIVEKQEEAQKVTDSKKQEFISETTTKQGTNIENTMKLGQALQHNVLQNIPTQDIMRIRGDMK